jgi:hypothetical protein
MYISKEEVTEILLNIQRNRKEYANQYNTMMKVCDVAEKFPVLYGRLSVLIPNPPPEAVMAIETHKTLLYQFLRNPCLHFASLKDAVKHVTNDTILVYITEIYLYGVFTLEQYVNYLNNVRNEDDDGNTLPYTPKQITLSGFPQRIVFMCAGEKRVVEKIKRYCELHFKSKVHIANSGDKTDVIIQSPIVKNLEESQKMFEEFCKYVIDREKDISKLELRQNIKKLDDFNYIISAIGDDTDRAKIQEFAQQFAIPVNLYINIGNGGIHVNNNINVNIKGDTRKIIAKNWIEKNPPVNKEKKIEYYEKYKSSVKDHLADSIFGKIMKESGYDTRKVGEMRVWIKK